MSQFKNETTTYVLRHIPVDMLQQFRIKTIENNINLNDELLGMIEKFLDGNK